MQQIMGGFLDSVVRLAALLAALQVVHCSNPNEAFKESLWIRSLPSGHIYTHMEFLITDHVLSHNPDHSRLFPRALLEILNAHDVYELHYSLTQGYWRLDSWGESNTSAPTGAQISAWISSDDERLVIVKSTQMVHEVMQLNVRFV